MTGTGTALALTLLTLWVPVAPSVCRAWCSEPAETPPPCHAHVDDSAPEPYDAGGCCSELESERLNGVGSPERGVFESGAWLAAYSSPYFSQDWERGTRAKPPDPPRSPFAERSAPLRS